MWRTFGVQTLNGSAQPILGDVLTAAMTMTQSGTEAVLTVASTANNKYQRGDRLVLDPLQTNQDIVLVTDILSSTTLLVGSQNAKLQAHANGAIVQLAISHADVIVQASNTNGNPLYLGADNTVTKAGVGNVIAELFTGGSFSDLGNHNNAFMTSDMWMAGTNTQSVIVAVRVV